MIFDLQKRRFVRGGGANVMDDYVERIAWLQSQILPHQGVVRRYFEAHAPAQLDVDDILAEALVRCYTSNNWREIEDGRRFLFAVARNYVLDEVRRSKVVQFEDLASLQLDVPDDGPLPDRIASGREDLRLLAAAIEQLPRRCREVFTLRRIHNLSPRDIAVQLGLSVSTVEKHLARALLLLTRAARRMNFHGPESADDHATKQGRYSR
jgi:RNA polymerase sigma-70 factor (ECF subfamily)